MLLVALLSWRGVFFFIYVVLQMQSERAAYVADAAAANLQEGQAAQLHALARETMEDRATLGSAANVDVLSAVNTIESVNASGTPVHVTNAQTVKLSAKGSTQQVNVVDLTVHSEGSFPSLMRTMQLLETLPLSTTIQQADLSRAPIDPNTKNVPVSWNLNVRLRFYTTTALST